MTEVKKMKKNDSGQPDVVNENILQTAEIKTLVIL